MGKIIKYLFIGIFVLFILKAIIPSSTTDAERTKASDIEREDEVKINAYLSSQTFIKRTLKAPSTAVFAKYGYGEDPATVEKIENGNYRVFIWTDAQNSFGAMLRNKFCIEMKPDGEMWSLIDIKQLN